MCCGEFLVLPVGAVAANDQRDDIAGSGKKETHHLQGQCAREEQCNFIIIARSERSISVAGHGLCYMGMHSRAGVSGQMNSIPLGQFIQTNMRQIKLLHGERERNLGLIESSCA